MPGMGQSLLNTAESVMYGLRNIFALLTLAATLVVSFGGTSLLGLRPVENPCPDARESELPLPTSTSDSSYQVLLYPFIQNRVYAALGWCVDKGVRDTGPFVKDNYYGTHPAVRIYYSPKMMYWLTGDPSFRGGSESLPWRDPREGPVPDGAMIVKEMFKPPAARYDGLSDAELERILLDLDLDSLSNGWTVMVKDAAGAKDGWYWGEVSNGSTPDSEDFPFKYPSSGFGQYCIRCHAAAEQEHTFSALRNVAGLPDDPVTFLVDSSWRDDVAPEEKPFLSEHDRDLATKAESQPLVEANEAFLNYFSSISRVPYDSVRAFPGETYDRVVAGPGGAAQFLSSDQCMMCHSGDSGPFGPVMFLKTGEGFGKGINISPYGEWRWSPMGLAGRDPIFHAQLESEVAMLRKEFAARPDLRDSLVKATVSTCLSCHGVMGKRQLVIDRKNSLANFELDWIYETNRTKSGFRYGALARDGISCAVCHHIRGEESGLEAFLMNSVTGQFKVGRPDELSGPFEDIVTFPMDNALGVVPKHDAYLQSSRLCGSCHTINLPIVDRIADEKTQLDLAEKNPAFKPYAHGIEQATYLEWLNSEYQNEVDPWNPATAKSCQDCHMPTGFHSASIRIDTLRTKIADFEDQDYPEADHRAPLDSIRVRFRNEGFARHRLQGLNLYLVSMFDQFNDVLGVRKSDYMSGSPGLPLAIDEFVRQARERTAELDVKASMRKNGELAATVTVANKTGHRFPSGVGFRRAFIELLVLENRGGRERVLWGSGRTNSVGVLVDGKGNPLATESFGDGASQPHYQTITRESQVQVYEELARDATGKITTSFLHRVETIKDNRLLPKGWSEKGPDSNLYSRIKDWIDATHPEGAASHDPDYADGKGTDIVSYVVRLPAGTDPNEVSVRATLYYQSIPPYYLQQRFEDVPEGPEGDARRRLYYLASNLHVRGTSIEDWKLALVRETVKVEVPR